MAEGTMSTSTVERLLALEALAESTGPLQAFRERAPTRTALKVAYRKLRTHLRRRGIQMPLHDLTLLCEQRIERLERQASDAKVPVELRVRQTLVQKATELFWMCDYRRAESSWVGGQLNRVTVLSAHWSPGEGLYAGVHTKVSKQWSQNGKWSANVAHHTIVIPRGWGAVARLRLIEALRTFILQADPVQHPEFAAWSVAYVKQGRGLSLRTAAGYVVRQGEHVALAQTLTGAARKLRAELADC